MQILSIKEKERRMIWIRYVFLALLIVHFWANQNMKQALMNSLHKNN